MSKFGPKKGPKINDYEKATKKEERKRRNVFWKVTFFFLSSVFVVFS